MENNSQRYDDNNRADSEHVHENAWDRLTPEQQLGVLGCGLVAIIGIAIMIVSTIFFSGGTQDDMTELPSTIQSKAMTLVEQDLMEYYGLQLTYISGQD